MTHNNLIKIRKKINNKKIFKIKIMVKTKKMIYQRMNLHYNKKFRFMINKFKPRKDQKINYKKFLKNCRYNNLILNNL
jgi:hypothetical protein